jgi:hypothetical protein
VLTLLAFDFMPDPLLGMEITPEQFAKIEHCLPRQRGNVSLSNLQVVNAILYVAEHGWADGRRFRRKRSPKMAYVRRMGLPQAVPL